VLGLLGMEIIHRKSYRIGFIEKSGDEILGWVMLSWRDW
jgi:hypothetical protein